MFYSIKTNLMLGFNVPNNHIERFLYYSQKSRFETPRPYYIRLIYTECQMVVMKGLTYHMIGHCNKLHYLVIVHTRSVFINYINVQCLLLPSPKI